MTDTRQALAALMGLAAECAQRKPLRAFEDFTEATHIGHRQFGRAYERADEDVRMLAVRLRAVFDALAPTLSAQPVAGAVAEPTLPVEIYGKFYEVPIPVQVHIVALEQKAAPAPDPTLPVDVREWMPVSEALRLSDLWTAGDLDNCGQWRAAIKVLADEVRALAASPHPEPSAQGEPVALPAYGQMKWDELIAAVCEAQTGNRAVGWERDPSYYVGHQPVSINMNSLNRIVSGFVARASAPSTPPPAVVEAVPLTDEQIEQACGRRERNTDDRKT